MTEQSTNERAPEDAAFDQLMDDLQIVYGMRVGHVITQDDIDGLNRLDKHYRDNDESATDAFHNGYEAGKRHAGGTTLAEQMAKVDAVHSEMLTERTLRQLADHRVKAMHEALSEAYRFITQPQIMSTPAGGPKTATYRIEGYNALTDKLRAAIGEPAQ